MRTAGSAIYSAARATWAGLRASVDARDIIGAAGIALLGTGIGMVDVPAALISIGGLLLIVSIYGSLRG